MWSCVGILMLVCCAGLVAAVMLVCYALVAAELDYCVDRSEWLYGIDAGCLNGLYAGLLVEWAKC